MADLTCIRDGSPISRGRRASLTLRLAVPAILAQLSSILMQYIDASMVGRLGADGAASVGLMSSSLWLFWGLCSAVTTGFAVQAAHRLGASSPGEARDVVRQGITACLAFSAAVTLVGLAIAPHLPHWLGGDEAICGDASMYFAIFVGALPMLTMNYLAGGMLRSAGNMKVPSLLNVGMCLMDVIFNWFLIFPTREIDFLGLHFISPGAGLGVPGAALGTVAAEVVTAALMLWYLICRQEDLRLRRRPRRSFRPTRAVLRRAVSISAPMTLEHAVFCGAQVMLTVIVAPLGVVAIAANAFAVTAESLCYMPGFGIGEAATTLVGQSYGAGRRELVKGFCHMTVWLGIAVMTAMGAVLYVASPLMMDIMTPVAAIRDIGVEVLRIEAFAEPLYAASIVAYGAFVGVGDTLVPAVMNFGSIWAVRIPLAAVMAPTMGLRGVWIAMAVELSLRGAIFLWRMYSGAWLRKARIAPPVNPVPRDEPTF
ncbi:MAG: MATE family efflux transporter [Bacteroides sp.]|nr:MATE family efflux transporter [Bacteroides sp.]MCM1094818.1 MATE family efflux transporter [Terasakiella sp.]